MLNPGKKKAMSTPHLSLPPINRQPQSRHIALIARTLRECTPLYDQDTRTPLRRGQYPPNPSSLDQHAPLSTPSPPSERITFPLLALPPELCLLIAQHLDSVDTTCLRRTCRTLYDLIKNREEMDVWERRWVRARIARDSAGCKCFGTRC